MLRRKLSALLAACIVTLLNGCARLPASSCECAYYHYERDPKTGFSNMVKEMGTQITGYCWGRVYVKEGGHINEVLFGRVQIKGTNLFVNFKENSDDFSCYRILLPDSLKDKNVTLVLSAEQPMYFNVLPREIISTPESRHINAVLKTDKKKIKAEKKYDKHRQFPD